MKFRSSLLFLAVLLLAVPTFAQDRFIDINAFAVWANPNGSSSFQFGEDVSDLEDIEFDSERGWGASVNVYWSDRVSTEFALSLVEPDLNVSSPTRGRILFTEPLEMMPVTAVLQYHFLGSSRFDPYVGVGGGYVLFQDIERREDIDEVEFDRVDFEDDIGFVANAGLRIGFTPNVGIYLDAKYMPLNTTAVVVNGGFAEDQRVNVDPLILAAGISFSF
ncbi:MAG TPA: OmpW family outer membrane protein [Thermoanaerobaculia bacterium]|nr:OmpW family outer membrane protein [Thermoanaerobaculia bacterium]